MWDDREPALPGRPTAYEQPPGLPPRGLHLSATAPGQRGNITLMRRIDLKDPPLWFLLLMLGAMMGFFIAISLLLGTTANGE